jgi:hypothetical protein
MSGIKSHSNQYFIIVLFNHRSLTLDTSDLIISLSYSFIDYLISQTILWTINQRVGNYRIQ